MNKIFEMNRGFAPSPLPIDAPPAKAAKRSKAKASVKSADAEAKPKRAKARTESKKTAKATVDQGKASTDSGAAVKSQAGGKKNKAPKKTSQSQKKVLSKEFVSSQDLAEDSDNGPNIAPKDLRKNPIEPTKQSPVSDGKRDSLPISANIEAKSGTSERSSIEKTDKSSSLQPSQRSSEPKSSSALPNISARAEIEGSQASERKALVAPRKSNDVDWLAKDAGSDSDSSKNSAENLQDLPGSGTKELSLLPSTEAPMDSLSPFQPPRSKRQSFFSQPFSAFSSLWKGSATDGSNSQRSDSKPLNANANSSQNKNTFQGRAETSRNSSQPSSQPRSILKRPSSPDVQSSPPVGGLLPPGKAEAPTKRKHSQLLSNEDNDAINDSIAFLTSEFSIDKEPREARSSAKLGGTDGTSSVELGKRSPSVDSCGCYGSYLCDDCKNSEDL